MAIFAAVVALVALFFTGMSAISANTQTKIQRQLRIDAAQPYVWADIRPDESVGVILNVVVGNSGPTVATNVRVTVDPPLPRIDQFNERIDRVEHRLAEGLKSLAPGRQLRWPLGQGFALVNKDGPYAGSSVDHIRPRFLGGSDRLDNLRLLCAEHARVKDHHDRELGRELKKPR